MMTVCCHATDQQDGASAIATTTKSARAASIPLGMCVTQGLVYDDTPEKADRTNSDYLSARSLSMREDYLSARGQTMMTA